MSTPTAASSPTRPPTLYPAEGWGAPKNRQGHSTGSVVGPSRRHRDLLGRQPHLGRRRHLLRTLSRGAEGRGPAHLVRGRRLHGRHEGQGLDRWRLRARAHAVRRPRRCRVQQHRGADPRTQGGRHRQGTGVPERGACALSLPGQVVARAGLPDLQRAHRRPAGTQQRPFLRRRPDQLVGSEGHPEHAGRTEGIGPQDVPVAAESRQGRRGQHLRLRQHRHGRGLGRDRGIRRAGQPPHRRDAAEDTLPEQQRRGRHDGQRRLVPRAVRQVRVLRASWTDIRV